MTICRYLSMYSYCWNTWRELWHWRADAKENVHLYSGGIHCPVQLYLMPLTSMTLGALNGGGEGSGTKLASSRLIRLIPLLGLTVITDILWLSSKGMPGLYAFILYGMSGNWFIFMPEPKHRAIKRYREAEVKLHTFLTLELDGGGWSYSHASHFYPGKVTAIIIR
jgi:hypothetical protein